MDAPKFNFDVCQGADFSLDLLFKDDSEEAIDLTPMTYAGQARVKYSDASPAFELTLTMPEQTGENIGHLSLTIPNATTTALGITKETRYYYDIEETITATGIVNRILQGIITITPEATK